MAPGLPVLLVGDWSLQFSELAEVRKGGAAFCWSDLAELGLWRWRRFGFRSGAAERAASVRLSLGELACDSGALTSAVGGGAAPS